MNAEADTCRKFIVPKLQAAGWDNEPHSIAKQRTITDGRVVWCRSERAYPQGTKRVEYLLHDTRHFNLAAVETKLNESDGFLAGLYQVGEHIVVARPTLDSEPVAPSSG